MKTKIVSKANKVKTTKIKQSNQVNKQTNMQTRKQIQVKNITLLLVLY